MRIVSYEPSLDRLEWIETNLVHHELKEYIYLVQIYCRLDKPQKEIECLSKTNSIKAYGMLIHYFATRQQLDQVHSIFRLALQHGYASNLVLFNMISKALPDPFILKQWFGETNYSAYSNPSIESIEQTQQLLEHCINGSRSIEAIEVKYSTELCAYLETLGVPYEHCEPQQQQQQVVVVSQASLEDYVERKKDEIVQSRLRFTLLARYSVMCTVLGTAHFMLSHSIAFS